MATNLSSIPFDSAVPQNLVISFGDLVSDLCRQVDKKILIAIMLIFSFYVFRSFMLWRGYKGIIGFIPSQYHKLILKGFERLESFLDTAALCSVLFLLYVFWRQQAFSFGFWLWLVILVFIMFVSVLAGVLDWVRGCHK